MENETAVKEKTPTELLIGCLEEFGEVEPRRVLVIFLDANGYIKHRRSHGLWDCEAIGLMEMVKHHLLQRMEEAI